MNVKISASGLAFKISAEELETLLSGQPLRESLSIGGNRLGISLHPVETDSAMSVSFSADTIRLCAAPGKIRELADLGRSREGLVHDQDGLEIELLVDFRTQKRPQGELPRRVTAPQ